MKTLRIALLGALLVGLGMGGATLAQQAPSTCEENRDMLLVEYGQTMAAFGRVSLENRQLKTKVAELEKKMAETKKTEEGKK